MGRAQCTWAFDLVFGRAERACCLTSGSGVQPLDVGSGLSYTKRARCSANRSRRSLEVKSKKRMRVGSQTPRCDFA